MEVRMNGYTPNDSLLRHWNVLWNEIEPARKSAPAADVVEDADGYHFYFEMAGINSESVDVRVEDGNLDRSRPSANGLSGRRMRKCICRSEHTARCVARSRCLRTRATTNIKAAYKDGVLNVTVPKRPESKPFKIKVEFDN